MKYVIDTSAIIRTPEILSKAGGVELYIPRVVIQEVITRFRKDESSEIMSLINSAVDAGAVIEDLSLDYAANSSFGEKLKLKLDSTDFTIARVALKLADRHGSSNVKVVTLDKNIANYLLESKIAIISGTEFLKETSLLPTDINTKNKAKKYAITQRTDIVVSFFIGIVATIVVNYLYRNSAAIIDSASIWGTMLVVFVAGTFLFWIRENFRLAYGVAEFLIGLLMAYYVFSPMVIHGSVNTVTSFQVLAGLYVMVRGLDNVGKGLENTRHEFVWKRLFYRTKNF